MTEPIVSFRNVSFSYDGPPVLSNVSVSLNEGDFVSVVGPNGGGKTTLLKLMLGMFDPDEGQVSIWGRSPREARRKMGYVPQQANLDPAFPVSVADVVLMGRLNRNRSWGAYSQQDKQAARLAMEEVGLADLYQRPFSALSGGQRQRVLIARALSSDPRLLLLDEPASGLDAYVEEEFFDLLKQLNRKMTVVVVSHDLGFVSQHVGQVVCVNRTVVTHPTSELNGTLIKEIYGNRVKMIRHDRHNCCGEESHE